VLLVVICVARLTCEVCNDETGLGIGKKKVGSPLMFIINTLSKSSFLFLFIISKLDRSNNCHVPC